MGLRDENLGVALLKALADWVDTRMGEVRAGHLETLLQSYKDSGNKSFSVTLPDGTKVASISLPEKKESYEVADEAEFLVWAKENHPEWVETVTVPPQPAMTYEQVDQRASNAWLKGLDHRDGIAFHPTTGEIPDGVAYHPAGNPTSFAVRFETDGRDRVLEAWQGGELKGLFGSGLVPQIGGGVL